MTVGLRPVRAGDDEFLWRVYRSTREPELDLTGWDEPQKQAFVQMQFEAQRRHYGQHYPAATHEVILVDGEPAGRLYVDRSPEEIRIVDITLLPEFRSRGTGTAILRTILDDGARDGVPVTIHVEQFNPARRLYDRLGFRPVAEHGIHVLMEWRSGAPVVS